MSAEGAIACWKISLACTRAEAEAIAELADPFPDRDEPPVLNTVEPDPARPDDWRLEAYVEAEPDAALIAAIAALAPSAMPPRIEPVADQDWVTLSQRGLEPIHAGRFVVHTAAHPVALPASAIGFRIEAGRAFGTGHHATTAGCLAMLDRLETGGARFADIIDIGTGTGLLAFAARALWPEARIAASDIDPVAIEVARENAAANAVPLGSAAGEVAAIVADGLANPAIAARAPFDCIIANILAQPLIDLAPAIANTCAPGAALILAGLLDHQAEAVAAAYSAQGFRPADRIDTGEWPALLLRKAG